MKQRFFETPFVVPAIIVGAALLLATALGSYTFYISRSLANGLSVTGSAKTRVTSDAAKWTFSISRHVTEGSIADGYAAIGSDLAATKQFLTQNGIADKDVTYSPVIMDEQYKDPNSMAPREYTLRQSITVQSTDVNGITALAGKTVVLANQGILVSTYGIEYYYTKLAGLRVSMLSDALKDAKARASEIASSNGQSVGSLIAAASGVVQVTAPNSVDVSDYGMYDTSSIEKDIMVTVRATFALH